MFRPPRDENRGVGLLEVIIAMAILMIGIAGIMRLFPVSMRNSQTAAQRTVVSELADTTLNRVRVASAQHVWQTLAKIKEVYYNYDQTQALNQLETADSLYNISWLTTTPLRGAQETFLQRVTFTAEMPDGRLETFVTYVSEL